MMNIYSMIKESYDVASNGRYVFVQDCSRILVFDRSELKDGVLAKYAIGKERFDDLAPARNPTKRTLGEDPRGLAADESSLYVAEKGLTSRQSYALT